MEQWNLASADEQLKQIVQKANCCGPQLLVLNGEGVIVLSETEYGRLLIQSLGQEPADRQIEPETGASFFAEMRRPFEEAAARGEDVYWPWDWDCERREWVAPADHAVPS